MTSQPIGTRKRIYTDGMCLNAGTKRRIGAYSIFVDGPDADGRAAVGTAAVGTAAVGTAAVGTAHWTREGRVTNQTMELAGALAGLEALAGLGAAGGAERPAQAGSIYTTSHYVMSCMTRWLPRWESTGWITKQRRPVQNGETLRRMADLVHALDVVFVRVQVRDVLGPEADATGDPDVLRGMREARRLLEAAAQDGLHSGCEKRRNVLCAWAGG